MQDLLTALALVLVLEGAAWALFPNQMRDMALKVQEIAPATLRLAGIIAAAIGLVVVWLIRG
jgi:uncharacterized protein YjeT (DUF2065 family)